MLLMPLFDPSSHTSPPMQYICTDTSGEDGSRRRIARSPFSSVIFFAWMTYAPNGEDAGPAGCIRADPVSCHRDELLVLREGGRGDPDHEGSPPGAESEDPEGRVDHGRPHRKRRQHETDGVPVEARGGAGQEEREPGWYRLEPRFVEQAPGQDARRVVEEQVARHEQQERGNDREVQGEARVRGRRVLDQPTYRTKE